MPGLLGWEVKVRPLFTVAILQSFVAGDYVKQLFVDSALAEAVIAAVEGFQQLADIFFGALHRGEAAGIFTGEGFGAGAIEGDEKIFADQCGQSRGAAAHHFGQVLRWPGEFSEALLPLLIEG